MHLKFPMSSGEFHSTHEILSDSLDFTVSGHDTDSNYTETEKLFFPIVCLPCTSTSCHT